MTKKEQRHFVKELIKNVSKEILNHSNQWPKQWDGIELRWYIKDHFDQCATFYRDTKRKRDYNNEVLVNNLV